MRPPAEGGEMLWICSPYADVGTPEGTLFLGLEVMTARIVI